MDGDHRPVDSLARFNLHCKSAVEYGLGGVEALVWKGEAIWSKPIRHTLTRLP